MMIASRRTGHGPPADLDAAKCRNRAKFMRKTTASRASAPAEPVSFPIFGNCFLIGVLVTLSYPCLVLDGGEEPVIGRDDPLLEFFGRLSIF
jgi:hypothetical protein